MNMTFRGLADRIAQMEPYQLDMTATVYVEGFDEFYPIKDVTVITETGVLDAGHPVMNTPDEKTS